MSIKIDELMIGDWLLYKSDSLDNAFPIQITREMFNKELVVWKDRFEPITLTPEILEKNGFNDTSFEANRKYKYVIHTNEYQLGYYPKTSSFNIYKKGIDPFYTKDVFCCGFQNIVKYVHELQHALKLCGIDKKIVV